MSILKLTRNAYLDMGTFGEIFAGGETFVTVERPWLDNRVNVSCIPEGGYILKPSRYNRGGYDAMQVVSVPHRSHIKMHIANTMFNVKGCIGIGEDLGWINGMLGVTNSTVSFARFMDIVGHQSHKLIIEGYRP